MNINLPESFRGILYVLCGLGSIVVTYLALTSRIGSNEVAAWTAFTAFIGGLARFNLGDSPKDDTP